MTLGRVGMRLNIKVAVLDTVTCTKTRSISLETLFAQTALARKNVR